MFMANSRAAYFRHAYTSNVEIAFREAVVIGHGRLMKISLPGAGRRSCRGWRCFQRPSIPANVALFQAGTRHHAHSPPRARARHRFHGRFRAARPRAAELAAAARSASWSALRRAAARTSSAGSSPTSMSDRLGQTDHGGEQHRRRRRHRRQHGDARAARWLQHDAADRGLCQRRRGRKIPVRRRQHLWLPQHGLRLSVHLSVPKDSPIQSFPDMLARAKANPGKLTYVITSLGSIYHLIGSWVGIPRPASTWCRCPIAARPMPSPT